MSSHELIEIYVARDETDAVLMKSTLVDNGIHVQISGGNLQSAVGDLPPGLPIAPGLVVRQCDAEHARQLILDMEQKRRDDVGVENTWTCPRCDMSVDATFDICWNCQFDQLEDRPSE